jgi:hypothetical protein
MGFTVCFSWGTNRRPPAESVPQSVPRPIGWVLEGRVEDAPDAQVTERRAELGPQSPAVREDQVPGA